MGPSGPDRRRTRDDEILPRLLDPAPQRGPRGTALPVREPGGAGLEPPEANGLPRVEARRAEGLPRRPRPEDRGRHPRREEGLGRRPRGRHQIDQGEAGPRPDRDRFPRGSRGPRRRTRPGHARDEHLRGRHGARPREDAHPRLRPGGPALGQIAGARHPAARREWDDEVVPGVLRPVPQRPRGDAWPVRDARTAGRRPPRTRRGPRPQGDRGLRRPPDPRPEPRPGAPRGDGDQSRGHDGRHGPARGGAHRGVEGQGPRAAQETEVPAPRDRFVGRPRTHAGVPGSAGRDVRVLRMVEGPRRHEPADLGGARVRGAGHGAGGRVPRGRDRPPASPAGLGDLLPTSGPVREDAEREPGQRRPHPPVRERAVRGRPGDRVTHGRTSARARDPLPLPVPTVPRPRRGLLVPPRILPDRLHEPPHHRRLRDLPGYLGGAARDDGGIAAGPSERRAHLHPRGGRPAAETGGPVRCTTLRGPRDTERRPRRPGEVRDGHGVCASPHRRCAPRLPLGPEGRGRTSGGVSIRRGSPRCGGVPMELASRRRRDDPPRPRPRGSPMNLSSVIVLVGVAADGWFLAFLAIRGRRPWLQSTFAACALSFLVVGAWSAARNEGILPVVREDLVLGLMLLTHALTAILVLGLIHGEALPRRRAVAFLLLVPVPLLAYLAPIEGWTAATAYEGNVLGGFLVLCFGVALAEAMYARYSSRLLAPHSFWLAVGVVALIVAGPVYAYELEFLGEASLAGANLASPIALACFVLVAVQADPFKIAPRPAKGGTKAGTLPASDAIVFE